MTETDTGTPLSQLQSLGLGNIGTVHRNLSVAALVEAALRRGEGRLSDTGAFIATTAPHTGRSPKDKFVVRDDVTETEVAWGKNTPISPDAFDRIAARMTAYLANRELFVFDGFAGVDPNHRLPIRIVTEEAWHNLFAHQLFVRPTPEELAEHEPQFRVVSAPHFHAVPSVDGTRSRAFILVNFAKGLVLIGGTRYAGEIKKSIFTVMNWLLPRKGVFPMHCSANVGGKGDTAVFFGLSGTGKTTLSADPKRRLIGDDEHGWSDEGIFNFEGGCYAKCIRLRRENEPQIWDAIRFGSVIENVVIDPHTRRPDYDLDEITENTRCAYPLDFIGNAQHPAVGGHPSAIVFLTCDAFGVLPPISRLDANQAMYHFLSGYTAKLAGTETGVTEPSATFSTCFGEPFLPLAPQRYATMLGEKIRKHAPRVFLVNTGWSGGSYGSADRIPLTFTRAMLAAALDGKLDDATYAADPIFGLSVPAHVDGVPAQLLHPRKAWKDTAAYDAKAAHLAKLFNDNFTRFGAVDKAIAAAAPKLPG